MSSPDPDNLAERMENNPYAAWAEILIHMADVHAAEVQHGDAERAAQAQAIFNHAISQVTEEQFLEAADWLDQHRACLPREDGDE